MAKFLDKTGLTFDDVCLIPTYNNVASRTEPSLNTRLTKEIQISIPIVNSPMSTVIGPKLAQNLYANGTIPIFHRFYSDLEMLCKDLNDYSENNKFIVSIGTKLGYEFKHMKVIADEDPNLVGVCIDVAHGHCSSMIDSIKQIKDWRPEFQVIAGNVCTARGTADLINAGADAVRVGIGPGSNCSTRMVTGFGSPQLTALMECAEEANRHDVPVISDGGIRDSRDIVIALAAGASSVMIGRLLAQTVESTAKKRPMPRFGFGPITDINPTEWEALYKGQASAEFQREGMAPEGVEQWLPVTGSVDDLIPKLLAGVRSGFTYGGARDIEELQRKAVFMPVSSTYMQESKPRE